MDTSFAELGLPPDLEEASTSSNLRIAAIEESQRQFEERIGSQMQRMEQLLTTLITNKDLIHMKKILWSKEQIRKWCDT